MTSSDVFDDQLAAWRSWQREPWGRLRYAVVWHVLQRHIADLAADRLRILDVGGGDGTEAVRLASAGHSVTLVDYSTGMLDLARRSVVDSQVGDRLVAVQAGIGELDDLDLGRFDLVLCHFVIQYLASPAEAVAAARRRLRPDGLLSLVAPNPASEVLAEAVRHRDFDAARDLLVAPTTHAATFDHEVARISPQQGEDLLEQAGLTLVHRYGGRMVLDLIQDDAVKYDTATFAAIERLEIALCHLSPYRDIGRFWQLIARRDCPPSGRQDPTFE